ncbi:MAG: 16S rRNA (uracil(1498)-N(3))-methyltransferase [Endomicrobiales bacterium]|nr:16S rRNA (uracil(1498)-N(3))-methyltransferase [Endomicrobiales bacterium]
MPHFFVPPSQIQNDRFTIKGEDVHYLANVRRYKAGDKIKIFDGRGKTMLGQIEHVSKDEIKGRIVGMGQAHDNRVLVTLYQAVPKGGRFDWLVEKSAELGVSRIVPLITERSEVRAVSGPKLERWRRLAKAAAQQCGRPQVTQIEEPQKMHDAVKFVPKDALNLIPWESENNKTIKEIILQNASFMHINVFIGPEGGFSVREVESAQKNGILPVTLGDNILRVETAGLLSVVLILNSFGEYDKHPS